MRLRLSRELAGLVDESAVVEEILAQAKDRLPAYAAERAWPLSLWVRELGCRKLVELRGAGRGPVGAAVGELTLHAGGLPLADAGSLAGRPGRGRRVAGARSGRAGIELQDALDTLEPVDRRGHRAEALRAARLSRDRPGARDERGRGGAPVPRRDPAVARGRRGTRARAVPDAIERVGEEAAMSESDNRSAGGGCSSSPRNSWNRQRGGEAPSIDEYVHRHPELAERIREIFPAMAMVDDMAVADASLQSGGRATTPGTAPMMTPGGWATSGSSARWAAAGWAWCSRPSRSRWGGTSAESLPHQGVAGSVRLRRFLFEARARAAAALEHRPGLRRRRAGWRPLLRHAVHPGPGAGRDLRRAPRPRRTGPPDDALGGRQSPDGSPVDRHEITTGSWPMAGSGTADAAEPGTAEAAGREPARNRPARR